MLKALNEANIRNLETWQLFLTFQHKNISVFKKTKIDFSKKICLKTKTDMKNSENLPLRYKVVY